MRRLFLMVLAATLLAGGTSSAADAPVLKTEKDKVNYGVGVNMATTLKLQGMDIDLDLVIRGMRDVYAGGNLLLTDEELGKAVTQYQSAVRKKRAQMLSAAAEENRKAGEAFLAENARKEGVRVLPSGLQYRIIRQGSGAKPAEKDAVECHYRGTFISGAEFENSRKSGAPAVLRVAEVIAGWREALRLMSVGSTWQIYVPSRLAYGDRGKPGSVGPNMTLIFEIELLAVK